MTAERSRFGPYEVLEREETRGGGFDALARGADGRDVVLWAGRPGSGAPEHLRETLAGIYHAGLPRVLGVETVEGRAVLVVQAYRGEPLARRLESSTLDPMEAIDRIRGIAAALIKAHRAGVPHGAITAQEILLADDGRTLLLHLGLAPFLAARPAAADSPASEGDDVFALARVLHRCLLGPEAALHPAEEALPGHLPQGLRRLLARALHPDPARRMRRAEELAGDLAVIRASWGTPATLRPPRPGANRRLRRAMFAAAAALILVLGWRSC